MAIPARIQKQIDRSGDCWIWLGHIDQFGYGKWGRTGAHRIVYEVLRGSIPDGLELDHLCRTHRCVNPAHLEPVTHAENMRRRYADYAGCSNGHPYDEANTYIRPSGHRDCRTCIRARALAYYHRKKSA